LLNLAQITPQETSSVDFKWVIAAVLLGSILAVNTQAVALLLAPFLLIWACFFRRYWLCAMAFLLGAVWGAWHLEMAFQRALPEEAGRQSWQIEGQVAELAWQGKFAQMIFYPSRIIPSQGQKPHREAMSRLNAVKINCYRCPYDINNGDTWRFSVRLKPIISFKNPQGFDYRQWMLAKGIGASGYIYVNDHGDNTRLSHGSVSLKDRISKNLPAQHYPILRALILGDKDALDASLKRFIYASGISHLFVVSGLHVGMVAISMMLLLAWLQRPLVAKGWVFSRLVTYTVGLSAALFYAYLTGFHVPVVRAVIMLAMGIVYVTRPGRQSPLDYWLLALFIVVASAPLSFVDMGAWLSFSIVLALLIAFYGASSQGYWLGLVKAQYVAFWAGALVLLGFSKSVAPLGFILNLLLIPVMAILVMPLALISLLVMWLGSSWPMQWLEWALNGLFEFIRVAENIFTWWPNMHEHNSLGLWVAVFVLLLPRALAVRPLGWLGLIVVLLIPPSAPKQGGFTLTVLDVGQGSAAFVKTQTKTILVDTAAGFASGMTVADYVILPYMQSHGIRQIDMLHITHSDNDHSGGRKVLERFVGREVNQTQCTEKRWQWDGVVFERFQPLSHQEGNNGSCLLRIHAQDGHSVLFTGDIEKPAEVSLLKQNKMMASEVLLVPHHGSKSSSSHEFIRSVDPKLAIISAAKISPYGHPHAEVVERYKEYGAKVVNTGSQGAIEVRFPPRQAAHIVSTYRPY